MTTILLDTINPAQRSFTAGYRNEHNATTLQLILSEIYLDGAVYLDWRLPNGETTQTPDLMPELSYRIPHELLQHRGVGKLDILYKKDGVRAVIRQYDIQIREAVDATGTIITTYVDILQDHEQRIEALEAGGGSGGVGTPGSQGPPGELGADGLSAYEVALQQGFTGTEAEWLASLVGSTGADGQDGATGFAGEQGSKGDKGDVGRPGPQGPPGTPADTSTSMGVIVHGSDAAAARPATHAQYIWIGSVDPANKQIDDLWVVIP